MKKTLFQVVSICVIIGGVFIGKYIEDHRSLSGQETKVSLIDTGYSQNEYTESIPNYDLDFRFPRESYTGKTYETPKLINKIEQQRLDGMFVNVDNHKKNIIKERISRSQDAELGKEYLMEGYIHTYQFKKFGISVKTSNYVDDNEYFVENPNSMKRYIDNIYDVIYSNDKTRYVRRYLLLTGAVFNKEYLEQHNAFTGTIISNETEDVEDHPIFNPKLVHFYQEIGDEINGDNIGADEVGNQTVIYIYDPKIQPNYYYKLGYTNACAPSCGIPEKIDIINNQ